MTFGQRIAALRSRKHLTQDQMAEALGVKRPRYNAWENGISNPDLKMVAAIAQFHGVTVDFLLGLPHPEDVTLLTADNYADGYTDESVFEDLEKELESISGKELRPNQLTSKEERDLALDLERLINNLENDEAMAFYGKELELDEEAKELLRISLEQSMRLAKQMAKKRFTPRGKRK